LKGDGLGKSARTYNSLTKATTSSRVHKSAIHQNGHTALAIDKGLFGWTDVERGIGQKKIELNEEAEIVSLMGSISVNNQGQANVHAHGTVALSDGSVKGGHWWEARVSIIAEVFVTEEEGVPIP
jgi:predicted DNA-binding protein with PD1-like motif